MFRNKFNVIVFVDNGNEGVAEFGFQWKGDAMRFCNEQRAKGFRAWFQTFNGVM